MILKAKRVKSKPEGLAAHDIPPTPCVASHGYGSAQILFLGGYPLNADLNKGMALSGFFESKLNKMLEEHGMHINECYRSVVVRERIEFMGTSLPKLRKAIAKVNLPFYEQMLLDEIKEVKPNVIVPLDDIALGTVFPHINGITKPRNRKHWIYCYRGSVLPLRLDWQMQLEKPIRVIPAISPQILLGDPAAAAYAGIDYGKIVANRYTQLPLQEYGTRWVAKSAEALYNYITRSLAANPEFLVFDIETYGGIITCIGFSFDGVEGCCVPLLEESISKYERAAMFQYVDKLLRHPIPKINQNIKYDWIILERFGFKVNNVVGDTMLKTSVLYPELPKGLDFLTSIYTKVNYYKDEGKDFDPKRQTKDKLYLYNAYDGIATHVVSQEQDKELKEDISLLQFSSKLATLLPIYKRMDEVGIRIDDERRTELINKYKSLYESNLFTLRALVNNDKFLPTSNPQVGRVVYEELNFPKRIKILESGEKNYRTDKGTLDDLLINHIDKAGPLGKSIVARIIVCRKLAKILEYLHTPISLDGRFRSTSNLCGTETGRSSYSKSLDELFIEGKLKRVGRSLQTISKHGFKIDEDVFEDFEDKSIAHDLRSMFVPSFGCIFIEADGSQAEARHVAVLAQDWDLLASFDKKPSVHSKTAGAIFDMDPSLITKSGPSVPGIGIMYYDLGKRIRHGGHYRMQGAMLSSMTHLPIKFCDDALVKFHAANPRIREIYHHEVVDKVRRDRKLKTPLGRSRTFFAAMTPDLEKEAIAYIPQSAVSDHTKFSIPLILEERPDIYFLAEMHDGLLMEVKKGEEMAALRVVRKVLERPLNYYECSLSRDFDLSVPAEVSVGENWMDLREVKL